MLILELIEGEQPSEIMIANAITRYLGVKDPNYLPFGLKNRIEEVGQSHARTFSYLTRFGNRFNHMKYQDWMLMLQIGQLF